MTKKKNKILYAASTASHLLRFHMPYIEALRRENDVLLMATGEGVDFPIVFDKHYFSLANLRSMRRIRKILKAERFDKIILNTTLTAFWVRLACIGLKDRPYVLNFVHGYLFSLDGGGLKKKILVACEKLTRGVTDAIAVMNQEDLESVRRYRLCKGEVFFTHGMGLDDAYRERILPRFDRTPYGADRILCSFVGELSGRKNQLFLIEATEQLKKEGTPILLLLVGEGGTREMLEREIERRGLQSDVILLGSRGDVPSILAATDLYVSASESEGLPFNMLEAMAYGLPIVASRVRGQEDLLSGHPEMLYELGDLEGFCKAFSAMVAQKKLGVDAVVYPNLSQYRLSAVFDENMKILSEGLS